MNVLATEQLHYTIFQGGDTPKSKQFEDFLAEICKFITEHCVKASPIFFSYAWPLEKDIYKEEWHTDFIRILKRHLEQAALIISLDQDESIVGHNLNAFMQRIDQSGRIFLFGSQTREEKLGWSKSGVGHENNLIVACASAKSIDKPFVVHIELRNQYPVELDSLTRKNIPPTTDYLLLLKALISEAYGLGEEFEQYWQERLIAHKLMDMLVHIPAQAPNMVKREGLLKELNEALANSDSGQVFCLGDEKSGKKQLCLSYIWDNYYRYRAVYWLDKTDLETVDIKKGSLVFLCGYTDINQIKLFLEKKEADTKVIVVINSNFIKDEDIINNESFFNLFGIVKVRELTPEEGRVLIKNVLGERLSSECDALIEHVGLMPERLLLACGYIQRNRITLPEYLEDCKHYSNEIAQFKLRPIRESKSSKSGSVVDVFEEETGKPRLKRRQEPVEYKWDRSDAALNISDPPPDEPQKVKLRCEELYRFRQSNGCHGFLEDIRGEIAKLKLSKKTVFISFATPLVQDADASWTTEFVQGIAESFSRAGVEIQFLQPDFDLVAYVEQNRHRINDIHVFIISTPARRTDPYVAQHDAMIKACQTRFVELQKPNQMFIMPIRLTSQKHYDKHYDSYAAYSFYEHNYMKQLRDLVAFMYWFDMSFEQLWRESALKHKLESNWWPNRPAENPHFVGREVALRDMQKHFWSSDKLLVISANGIGGAGKTQLAQRFAQLYGHKYSHIFWLNAGSREALLQSYVALGLDKNLFDESDKTKSLEERAKKVINWMQNECTGWLLIIDNATNYEEIDGWVPAQGGQVLVTSRYKEWPGQHNISVELFTPAEAREYFVKALGGERVEQESQTVDELIKVLGPFPLPLVVAQACAYIKNNPITIAVYLELFKKKKLELLGNNVRQTGEDHDAVKVTWHITLDCMRKEFSTSSPVEILYLCTQLHHLNIPRVLFLDYFKNSVTAVNALRVAVEYSMINWNADSQTISMHGIVQEVLEKSLTAQDKERYLTAVYNSLHHCYPSGESVKDISAKRVFSPHLETVERQLTQEDKRAVMLELVALAADDMGDVQKSHKTFESLFLLQKSLFGDDAPSVARTMVNWGRIHGDLGQYREMFRLITEGINRFYKPYFSVEERSDIEKFSDRVLSDEEVTRLNFPENSDYYFVLRAWVELGLAYSYLGEEAKGKKIVEAVFALQQKALDPDDSRVLRTVNILSDVYPFVSFEDARRKCALLSHALEVFKRVLGSEHRKVAKTLVSLARVYRFFATPDSLQKARDALKDALNIIENQFGTDHFETIEILITLGDICFELSVVKNDDKDSVREGGYCLQRAQKTTEVCYGLRHTNVARVYFGLSDARNILCSNIERFRLLTQAVDIFEQAFGFHSPQVGHALMRRGAIIFTAEEFLIVYPEKREQCNRGEKGFQIFSNRYSSNVIREMAVRYLADHVRLDDLERAETVFVKCYGMHHPHVALVALEIGFVKTALQSFSGQRRAYERALKIFENTRGQDDLLVARGVLASVNYPFTHYTYKCELIERAIKTLKHFLGDHHVEVAGALCKLIELNERASVFKPEDNKDVIINQAEEFKKAVRGLRELYNILRKNPHIDIYHPLSKKLQQFMRLIKPSFAEGVPEAKLSRKEREEELFWLKVRADDFYENKNYWKAEIVYLDCIHLMCDLRLESEWTEHETKMLGVIKGNLSGVCWANKDTNRALLFSMESLDLYKSIGDVDNVKLLENRVTNMQLMSCSTQEEIGDREDEAIEAFEAGDYVRAIQGFTECHHFFEDDNPWGGSVLGSCVNLSHAHRGYGNYMLARFYLEKALSCYKINQRDEDVEKTSALLKSLDEQFPLEALDRLMPEAKGLYVSGNYSSAIKIFKKCRSLFSFLPNSYDGNESGIQFPDICFQLGKAYWKVKKYQKSITELHYALLCFGKTSDMGSRVKEVISIVKEEQFAVLHAQAEEDYQKGNHVVAYRNFHECLDIYEYDEVPDEKRIAMTLCSLGQVNCRLFNYAEAKEQLERAMELAKKNELTELVEKISRQIEHVEYALRVAVWHEEAVRCMDDENVDHVDEAVRLFNLCLNWYESSDVLDKRNAAFAHDNLGFIYHDRDHHLAEINCLERALALWIELKDDENSADVKNRLAQAQLSWKIQVLLKKASELYAKKKYFSAVGMYKACIQLYLLRENMSESGVATIFHILGIIYQDYIHDRGQAFYYLKRAQSVLDPEVDAARCQDVRERLATLRLQAGLMFFARGNLDQLAQPDEVIVLPDSTSYKK